MTRNRGADDLRDAQRPIASLLGKSEKAQQKLKPGTWQHTMLGNNIKALRIASVLMNPGRRATGRIAMPEQREALRAMASMKSRTRKSMAMFARGTSQHTLQRNRLNALRVAESLIKASMRAGRGTTPASR